MIIYPRIVYSGNTVEPNAPLGLWESGFIQHGGARQADSGVGTGYTKRTDYLVDILMRCWESEIPAVSGWIEWAMNLGTFTFRFDKNNAASQYTCRLVTPRKNEVFTFRRSPDYPTLQEIQLTLSSSTRFTYVYL